MSTLTGQSLIYLLLSLEHTCNYTRHFREHRNQQCVVTLVHQSFKVLELIIELLLDVVLHLMSDQPAGYLFTEL
jgi:hypothetical protein